MTTKEKHNAYFREYRKTSKWLLYRREHMRQWRKKHGTTKDSIRGKVAWALSKGRIVKLPCQECGELKVQAHHPDYRRPLFIVWLCSPHHRERDIKEGKRKN